MSAIVQWEPLFNASTNQAREVSLDTSEDVNMTRRKVSIRGPLSARAAAVAQAEGLSMDEFVDYVVRRYVDEYEFDEEPEEDDVDDVEAEEYDEEDDSDSADDDQVADDEGDDQESDEEG